MQSVGLQWRLSNVGEGRGVQVLVELCVSLELATRGKRDQARKPESEQGKNMGIAR
jgi:hypothetical protein